MSAKHMQTSYGHKRLHAVVIKDLATSLLPIDYIGMTCQPMKIEGELSDDYQMELQMSSDKKHIAKLHFNMLVVRQMDDPDYENFLTSAVVSVKSQRS